MAAASPDYMVIDVTQVAEIDHPQNVLNHWGLSVATTEEVDRIHAAAMAGQERFGLRKVQKPLSIHGAYGFYFADRDMNWWEIECRLHGKSNPMVFAKGDFDKEEQVELGIETPRRRATTPAPGVIGDAELTHGTLESRDLARSRRLYEEVLALRCVRHSPPSQLLGGQGSVCVVAVALGESVHEQGSENRWIVTLQDAQAVAASHRAARGLLAELGILEVGQLIQEDGVTRFRIRDADSNWWDVANLAPDHHEALFQRGTVA